jgi:farnesyl diphosphate synthase
VEDALNLAAIKTTTVLDLLLPPASGGAKTLYDAMRYSALNGGKRIRPFLVLTTAALFNVPETQALRVAAAVEMIHCYSLIHDDLPAMDNSDVRRGVPTCHKQFSEATAILAGDALLTLAFEVLADPATHEQAAVRCALITHLAKAAGGMGMIAGQMLDMAGEKQTLPVADITTLHRLKTGALIRFSCVAGAILVGHNHQKQDFLDPCLRRGFVQHPAESPAKAGVQNYTDFKNYAPLAEKATDAALEEYGDALGLLFQLTDDLLDVEGDTTLTGKPQGQDALSEKASMVNALGLPAAKQQADVLRDKAIAALGGFGEQAVVLKELVRFVRNRRV